MTTSTAPTGVPALTSATFDELVAGSPVPVVVDFWAGWCGPCAPMAESLAVVAAEHPDGLAVASVDVDAQPDLARRHEVLSLPTLLVFVDGQLVDRIVGARGPARLREDLARHL